MPWLKVYEWEQSRWPQFRDVKLTERQAKILFRRLERHYNGELYSDYKLLRVKRLIIHQLRFRVRKLVRISRGGPWGISLSRKYGLNLGTLIHEFTHVLVARKHGLGIHHGTLFRRELCDVYDYAARWLPKGQKLDQPAPHMSQSEVP